MSTSLSPISSGTASVDLGLFRNSAYQFTGNPPKTAAGVTQRLDSLYATLQFPAVSGTASTFIYADTNNIYAQTTQIGHTSSGAGGALNPRKADLTRLLARIEGFQKLPTVWAGDDTVMVDSNTYDTATQILQGLPHDVPLPQATPSADGEIGLTWMQQGGRFEVVIQPDRHVLWLVNHGHDYEPGGLVDLGAHKSLFDLNEALRQFYHG